MNFLEISKQFPGKRLPIKLPRKLVNSNGLFVLRDFNRLTQYATPVVDVQDVSRTTRATKTPRGVDTLLRAQWQLTLVWVCGMTSNTLIDRAFSMFSQYNDFSLLIKTTKVLNYRDIIFFSERPFITEAIAKQSVGMEEATRKKNTPKKKGVLNSPKQVFLSSPK